LKQFVGDSTIILISGSPLLKVYDLKTVIYAISRMNAINIKPIFVFYRFASVDNDSIYEKEIYDLIKKEIKKDYVIYEDIEPELYNAILNISDIFIRSTTYDGDSVSIREALYLGKQVIASDSVSRPEGCLLFKTGNEKDLLNKIKKTLKNIKENRRKPYVSIDFADEIINIYTMLLSKSR